jgi:hypothetical protein
MYVTEDWRNQVCPFVDRGDARCSAHLTMKNLASAYVHCADRYTLCPIFQELLVDESCERAESAACALAVS